MLRPRWTLRKVWHISIRRRNPGMAADVASLKKLEIEIRVPLKSDNDLVVARREGRVMAEQLGFSAGQATLVATAISELARNIVTYAGSGEILLCLVNDGNRRGITVVAHDDGPGIADTRLAVQEGYSTSGGL